MTLIIQLFPEKTWSQMFEDVLNLSLVVIGGDEVGTSNMLSHSPNHYITMMLIVPISSYNFVTESMN